jgi:oligopeptide transport system substrate-binding protein
MWRPASLLFLLAALLIFSSTACLPDQLPPAGEDILRLRDSGPITLDPAIAADFSSYTYIMQIFSGLVRLDHEMNAVPDIAESWESSTDGKTYTFHLRQGVKFHSGREIEAADFKYSWERACDPDTGSGTAATYLGDIVGVKDMVAGIAEEISGVEVLGDYTLQVTIDAPRAYFLSKLAYPTALVVDRTNVESGQNWWREPEGTGPFVLKEWQMGQWLILERNEDYYGGPPKLQQVYYLLAGSPMPMYELGQIDVVSVYGSYIYRVRDESGPFYPQLSVTPELSLDYIGFNTAQPPFDDAYVRRAFSHAVDKESITRVILMDMGNEADGILPPGMPAYNESLQGLDYDVQKANDLIAMSKYEDVSNLPPITLTVTGYGNYISPYLGAIIQGWQQDLGVEVSVRQMEPEDFIYNLKQEKDEMFALAWIADYPDPHNFLDILFRSGSENNAFEYSNPDLDALLDSAAVEQDNATRLAMYRQAEQIVLDDAPCIPLWHGANYVLVRPYVEGYELSLLGIPDLSQVCVENP